MTAFRLSVTDGLELRLFEEEDAEPYSELINMNRDELNKWFPWVEQSRYPEGVLRFIREARARFEDGGALELALWHEGKPVGSVGLNDINHRNNRSANIGYWLSKSLWGRGFMTASCRRIIDLAFRERELNRLEIRCAVDNLRSQRIPERLGFKREGVLRQGQRIHDGFQDMILYSMLAEERMHLTK